MENSTFFKNIWRFNGIVIALISSLALILGIILLFTLITDEFKPFSADAVVNIEKDSSIQHKSTLGAFISINGSASIAMPLSYEQNYNVSYEMRKSAYSIRNYLFYNFDEKQSHWLFPDNKKLIINTDFVTFDQDIKSNGTNSIGTPINNNQTGEDVQFILYQIVKNDTDKDNRLSETDKITLSVSDKNGDNIVDVLENIDSVLGFRLVSPKQFTVMFYREGKPFVAEIHATQFFVFKEEALTMLQDIK